MVLVVTGISGGAGHNTLVFRLFVGTQGRMVDALTPMNDEGRRSLR